MTDISYYPISAPDLGIVFIPTCTQYTFEESRTTHSRYSPCRRLLIEVGTVATLASSIANVSAVFALKGLETAFVFPLYGPR